MRRTNCTVLGVALATSTMAPRAYAETYEVGPSKSYATPSEVADLLAPGDVVVIEGDHTYPGGVVFSNAGTVAEPITIVGLRKNGKRPVLAGSTNTVEAAANHYVFEGLELTGGSARCFFHHGHDIVLRDSVVHDCPAHGVLGADTDSGSLLMQYVEVYGCGEGTQKHQIYMATDESAHPGSVFRMEHCYLHDATGGNNVKSRAERNEIYYNWIEGAMYHELELIGPDGQDPSLAREDSDVVGNVLVKRASTYVVRFGGDGTGETNGRYRFVNNTVITEPGGSAVFRLFDGIESLSAHNNVFYTASGGVNIARQVEVSWTHGTPWISGSNNWAISGSINVPTAWSGTTEGAEPGFVDPTALDVRLTPESPLIDAGTSATPDPAGAPFPNPLAAPMWAPPLRELEAPGASLPRSESGAIDTGAFDLESSLGSPGEGGGSATGGQGGAVGGCAESDGGHENGGCGSATGAGGGDFGSPSEADEDTDTGQGGCAVGSSRDQGLTLGALLGLALLASRRLRRAIGVSNRP